jgi:hypothetical protein
MYVLTLNAYTFTINIVHTTNADCHCEYVEAI